MEIDEDHVHTLRQNPSTYTELINSSRRGLHRIGTVFNYIATYLPSGLGQEESIHALLEVFWPMLEKFFLSEHNENANLSTAACWALALAIKASGQQFLTLMLPKVLHCMSTNFLSFQTHECYLRTGKYKNTMRTLVSTKRVCSHAKEKSPRFLYKSQVS